MKKDDCTPLFLNRDSLPREAVLVDQLEDAWKEFAEVSGDPLPDNKQGVWVYFPWRNTAVHILPEEFFKKVRTSRNKNIITDEEQGKFGALTIGIAGLNVGNPGAICLALEGGGDRFKFADFDPLSLSNLNRFRASLIDLGVNKATLTARQAYEINPYLSIEIFPDGLLKENIKNFLLDPKIDLLIEETDNLLLKIELREMARDHKIPVLMVTGNGANVIIDIERYDLDPNTPLLNGHLSADVLEKIKMGTHMLPKRERVALARDFMGGDNLTQRLRASFEEVGATLPGIPQIAESSFLRGAAISYVVREIAVGNEVASGRYTLNLDEVL